MKICLPDIRNDGRAAFEQIYVLFLLGYCLQVSYLVAQYGAFYYLSMILYLGGYALALARLKVSKVPLPVLLVRAALLSLGIAVIAANPGSAVTLKCMPLNVFLLLILADGVELETILRLDICVRVLFTLILSLLTLAGAVKNVTTAREDGTVRYSIGYWHPNRLAEALFLICLYALYLRRKKLEVRDLMLQILVFFFIWKVTMSRSAMIGMLMILFYTCMSLLLKGVYLKQRGGIRLVRCMMVIVPVTAMVLILLLVVCYDSRIQWMKTLNKAVNSRIDLGQMIFRYFGVNPFGSNVRSFSWDEVLARGLPSALAGADIMYVHILTAYGYIIFAVYIGLLLYALIRSVSRDRTLCYCLGVIIMIACVEHQYFAVEENAFLLYAAPLFTLGSEGRSGCSRRCRLEYRKESSACGMQGRCLMANRTRR